MRTFSFTPNGDSWRRKERRKDFPYFNSWVVSSDVECFNYSYVDRKDSLKFDNRRYPTQSK